MKHSIKTGVSFGLTSGVITTLGLIIGLYSGTGSMLVIIGGILTIAIADSFSDALGIHIAEEAKNAGRKEIWESTFSTLIVKLIIASSFIFPFLLLNMFTAVIACIVWGGLLLSAFSYVLAKKRKFSPLKVILEHLGIALLVIIITYYVGILVSMYFT